MNFFRQIAEIIKLVFQLKIHAAYEKAKDNMKAPFFFMAVVAMFFFITGLLRIALSLLSDYYSGLKFSQQVAIAIIVVLFFLSASAVYLVFKLPKKPKKPKVRVLTAPAREAKKRDEKIDELLPYLLVFVGYLVLIVIHELKEIVPILASEYVGYPLLIFQNIIATTFIIKRRSVVLVVISLFLGIFIPGFFYEAYESPLFFAYLIPFCLHFYFLIAIINKSWLKWIVAFLAYFSYYQFLNRNEFELSIKIILPLLIFTLIHYTGILYCLSVETYKINSKFFRSIKLEESILKRENLLLYGVTAIYLISIYVVNQWRMDEILGYYLVVPVVYFAAHYLYMVSKKRFGLLPPVHFNLLLFLFLIANSLFRFSTPIFIAFFTISAYLSIYLGFKLKSLYLRVQGYFFLSIALFFFFWKLQNLHFGIGENIFNESYFYLFVMGLVLYLFVPILHRNRAITSKNRIESFAPGLMNDGLSVWFLLFYGYTFFSVSFEYLSYIFILPAIFFTYKGYSAKLVFTKYLGYVVFGFSILYSWLLAHYGLYISVNYTGIINLLGTGFLIVFLKYFYIFANTVEVGKKRILVKHISFNPVHRPDEEKLINNMAVKLANFIISIWILYIMHYILFLNQYENYFILIMMLPASVFLLHGYTSPERTTRIIGYLLYLLLVLWFLYLSFYSKSPEFHYYLAVLGIIFSFFWIVASYILKVKKIFGLIEIQFSRIPISNKNAMESTKNHFSGIFHVIRMLRIGMRIVPENENKLLRLFRQISAVSLSIWIIVFYLLSGLTAFGLYGYNIAILPLFLIFYLAGKRKSSVIEIIGLLNFVLMLLGAFHSIKIAGSYRFSAQPLFGQILLIEIYFCLWLFKWFYVSYLPKSKLFPFMTILRRVFYFLLPLLALYFAARRFPEYIDSFVWIAAFMAFALAEIVKKEYKAEYFMYLLTNILVVASIVLNFRYMSYVSITVGSVCVALLYYWQIYVWKKEIHPYWSHLTYLLSFYPCVPIHIVSYNLSGSLSLSLFLISIYLSFISIYRRYGVFGLQSKLVDLAFPVSNFMLIIGSAIYIIQLAQSEYTPLLLDFIAWIVMTFALFVQHQFIYRDENYPWDKTSMRWRIEVWFVNLLYLTAYIAFFIFTGKLTFSDLGIWIVLFVCSISFLVFSFIKRYRYFVPLSLVILSTAIINLLLEAIK